MFNTSPDLQERFLAVLAKKGIPARENFFFLKWLRYYLDFCLRYGHRKEQKASLNLFLKKLREKKQTPSQFAQASRAVLQFFEDLSPEKAVKWERETTTSSVKEVSNVPRKIPTPFVPISRPDGTGKTSQIGRGGWHPREPVARKLPPFRSPLPPEPEKRLPVPQTGASWVEEFKELYNGILVRHYSPKTGKAYGIWLQKFQTFTRSKTPELLSTSDVKEFLTYLAVRERVSASS